MNHKQLKSVVKTLEKMGVKLKPTQVVDLTLKHIDSPTVDTIKVKRPVGRPKGSATPKPSNKVSLPDTVKVTKPHESKHGESDTKAKFVLAKMVKEPIDDYDKTVFTYLNTCVHNISERGLAMKLNLTGDDLRLTASLYKGMNKKIVQREKLKGTYLYFTVKENLPILNTIIGNGRTQ